MIPGRMATAPYEVPVGRALVMSATLSLALFTSAAHVGRPIQLFQKPIVCTSHTFILLPRQPLGYGMQTRPSESF